MHKMQNYRFRRTSTIVNDDVSYDDAAAAIIFFLLPSTQPILPPKTTQAISLKLLVTLCVASGCGGRSCVEICYRFHGADFG